MTIIQPSSKFKLNFYTFLALFAILLMGGFYIYEYNTLVLLHHGISAAEEKLIGLQNQESDMKNELYAVLNPNRLKKFGLERGLVIEKRPAYLKLGRLGAELTGGDLTLNARNAVRAGN